MAVVATSPNITVRVIAAVEQEHKRLTATIHMAREASAKSKVCPRAVRLKLEAGRQVLDTRVYGVSVDRASNNTKADVRGDDSPLFPCTCTVICHCFTVHCTWLSLTAIHRSELRWCNKDFQDQHRTR